MNLKKVLDLLNCSDRTLYRYVQSGKIKRKGKGMTADYDKKTVMEVYAQLKKNQETHRPDVDHNPAKLSDTVKIKKLISAPTKAVLNERGKEVLLSTTALVRDNDLLEGIDKQVLLRYAMAVQLKEKYIAKAMELDEKYYFDIAKMFTSEIQHYENHLGLTPLALSKLKPREEEKKEVTSMMGDLLK